MHICGCIRIKPRTGILLLLLLKMELSLHIEASVPEVTYMGDDTNNDVDLANMAIIIEALEDLGVLDNSRSTCYNLDKIVRQSGKSNKLKIVIHLQEHQRVLKNVVKSASHQTKCMDYLQDTFTVSAVMDENLNDSDEQSNLLNSTVNEVQVVPQNNKISKHDVTQESEGMFSL